MEEPYSRVYAKIDLDNIVSNMKAMIQNLPAGTKIIGVVKTDGYGHGAVPAARVIEEFVWGYATATIEEAVILREHGFTKPVLVLGSVSKRQSGLLVDYDISPTIYEYDKALHLSELAGRAGRTVKIHLAVDTGMSRIGFRPDEEGAAEAASIGQLPHIEIEGLFTHFSRADETGKEITEYQYGLYNAFARSLEEKGLVIPMKHCSNSAAILDCGHMSLNAVRAGIAMYGLYPSGEVDKDSTALRPAMELYSFVTYVKEIEAGTPVSYGGTFVAPKRMRIATVGIGYGDGYPRSLSGKGEVLIRGMRAPILGRICMDQLMVDVSHIPGVCEDDKVTLIGRDGSGFISMEELAERGDGFHYEIPCVLGKRVPRVYVSGGSVVGTKDYNKDRYEDFIK